MGMLPYEEICLAAITANQGVVADVDHALKQATKDIADPNTHPTKTRTVTLKIKLKPPSDGSRAQAQIECEVDLKRGGDIPRTGFVTISRDGIGSIPMADQLSIEAHLEAHKGGSK
jgi:hypothetical protein